MNNYIMRTDNETVHRNSLVRLQVTERHTNNNLRINWEEHWQGNEEENDDEE